MNHRSSVLAVPLFVLSIAIAAPGTDNFQYLSPLPGSTMHRPETNIIIRHGELIDSSTVLGEYQLDVTGSVSGIHHGAWLLSDDSKTLVFNPSNPFAVGEDVSVFLHPGILTVDGTDIGTVAFSFTITSSNIYRGTDPDAQNTLSYDSDWMTLETGITEPPQSEEQSLSVLDSLPAITLLYSNNPSPGYIFLSNIVLNTTIPNTPYLIIIDNSGTPVAYRMTGVRSYDFKLQPNRTMTYFRSNVARHIVLDTTFQVLDTIGIGNGYAGALHELHILPNGHALLLGIDRKPSGWI